MLKAREKFATQVDSRLLSDLRELAKGEGRQLQALVEEAIESLLEQRRQSRARPHVMTAYKASHKQFGPLYRKLAE